MAQRVECPTSAQVMISWSVSSSPASSSVLTAQSLEPASDSVDISLRTWERGTWVAQLVKCPTSAQVMISWFVGSSPALGSMLTAQSLEPASNSVCVCVCVSLSAPPLLALCLCLTTSSLSIHQSMDIWALSVIWDC